MEPWPEPTHKYTVIDDLYMSVPALAQMGGYQIMIILKMPANRLFSFSGCSIRPGVYVHGWVRI
jgi:hypothetical protein